MKFKFGGSSLDRGITRRRTCSSISTLPPRIEENILENEVFFTAYAEVNRTSSKSRKKEGRSISFPVLMSAPEHLLLEQLESFTVSVDSSSLSSLEDLPSTDLCSTDL
jgi:hypothetical protein